MIIIIIIYFEKAKSSGYVWCFREESMKSKCLVNTPEPPVSWSGTQVCLGLWVPEFEFSVRKMKKRRIKKLFREQLLLPPYLFLAKNNLLL